MDNIKCLLICIYLTLPIQKQSTLILNIVCNLLINSFSPNQTQIFYTIPGTPSHLLRNRVRQSGLLFLDELGREFAARQAYHFSSVKIFLFNTLDMKINKMSFTLYPAYSRVGRGNLVLRHSVPHFPPNFGGMAC